MCGESATTTTTTTSTPLRSVLVTGGCGYIGSHTIVCLLTAKEVDYRVVVVDNLVNSSAVSLDRVAELAGLSAEERERRLVLRDVDLLDADALRRVFDDERTFSGGFVACVHFAGLKAVGESARLPLLYYRNNLTGTTNLLELMEEFGCRRIVFSSSATVYGDAETVPIRENAPVGTGITNAYGRTKHMIEEILGDLHRSKETSGEDAADDGSWSVTILRYFNPVGAHPSGAIGEDPNGIPNNLMPYVSQVAVGRREYLTVFGDDYPTPDGTGVRDYLHVVDLAEGHLAAIRYMDRSPSKLKVFNLGTGNGCSVLDMVRAMERACGHPIPYKVGPRRPGDVAESYADATAAKTEMGWEATRDLDAMCRDLWCWQSRNPNGFANVEKEEEKK